MTTTADEINAAFASRQSLGELAGIMRGVSHEPLVSSDVIKSPYSSVVDAELTTVTGGTQAKVIAWYDNEWGYATRLVELAQRVARAESRPRLIRENHGQASVPAPIHRSRHRVDA